jgi:hypothetical protein
MDVEVYDLMLIMCIIFAFLLGRELFVQMNSRDTDKKFVARKRRQLHNWSGRGPHPIGIYRNPRQRIMNALESMIDHSPMFAHPAVSVPVVKNFPVM